jgi:hypothetical protein
MNSGEIIDQTKLAYDFMQKLFFEVSYLIKEIEGLLGKETPPFVICRPRGYNISTLSSNGLDSSLVNLWLLRKFSVAFIHDISGGKVLAKTETPISPETKVLYVRIILNDKELVEPMLYMGVLYDFNKKPGAAKWQITKVEQLLTQFEYNESKFFSKPAAIDYEDAYVKLKGKMISTPLFIIDSSETLNEKVVQPAVKLFHSIHSE